MKNRLEYWGKLGNGEAVFVGKDGEAAVEKDFRHLVTPTPEEKREIFRTWPGLIDMHLEQKVEIPGNGQAYEDGNEGQNHRAWNMRPGTTNA